LATVSTYRALLGFLKKSAGFDAGKPDKNMMISPIFKTEMTEKKTAHCLKKYKYSAASAPQISLTS
jgi:hypothetical protein